MTPLILYSGALLLGNNGGLAISTDCCCGCDDSCMEYNGGTCVLSYSGVCVGPSGDNFKFCKQTSPDRRLRNFDWVVQRTHVNGWYDTTGQFITWNNGWPDEKLTDCVFWTIDTSRAFGNNTCSPYTAFSCCIKTRNTYKLWLFDCQDQSISEITSTAVQEFNPDFFLPNYRYVDFGAYEGCIFFGLNPPEDDPYDCECCNAPVKDWEDICGPMTLDCAP